MDEILIEEKKYVSSKRAAEMTGYAKDYIGQLCREGRVPARLIGRSWYVLEAAIQDHRFGNVENEPEIAVKENPPASVTATWESPRYETSSVEEESLPIIIKSKEPENTEQKTPQHIQDSWKEWFDRFDHTEKATELVQEIETTKDPEPKEKGIKEPELELELETEENMKVNVPIHAIYRPLYQPPPEDLLPHRLEAKSLDKTISGEPVRRKSHKRAFKAIQIAQMAGAVLAILVAITAIIGSGYFDKYILANGPTRVMAGITLYNRK